MANRRRSYGPTFRWRGITFRSFEPAGSTPGERSIEHDDFSAEVRLSDCRTRAAAAVRVRVYDSTRYDTASLVERPWRATVTPASGLTGLVGRTPTASGRTRTEALNGLDYQIRQHRAALASGAATLSRLLDVWPDNRRAVE